MKYIMIFAIGVLLAGCECSYQYAVHASNETGEDITIKFKSITDDRGEIEDEVTLKDGEGIKLINTVNIHPDEGCTWDGAIPEHCKYVAEYVDAYLADGTQSKLKWCNNSAMGFFKSDIQQGEFEIIYLPEHF